MQWENVHVFISSTFNDMHAERDYLVKRVFPQLSAWCEERRLHLLDIDLRWGVSEADATQNKRVVQVCLDRIDACRPFFVCLLGQRRGWVPSEDDISGDTYASFPRLFEQHYAGNVSVTEMEILLALIDPLHNGILRSASNTSPLAASANPASGTSPLAASPNPTSNTSPLAAPTDHAFFFLRDPGYLSQISNPDTREVYTNETEANPEQANAELKRWREEVIPGTGRPVFSYSASWREDEYTPEIALPLSIPTTAPQGSEVWRAAFARWARMWESKGVEVSADGEIVGREELARARAYNQALTQGRLGSFKHDGVELAEIIIEQLKAAITKRFGDRTSTQSVLSPLQHELDQQAQFLRAASDGYIERQGDFTALNSYLQSDEREAFVLTANAGMGKTSLLARFVDTYQATSENETLHYRFIGGSDDSVSVERLLRSLLTELKEAGKITCDFPTDLADMLRWLRELLAEAGHKGKTILVVDAVNQLQTGPPNLSWVLRVLPEKVKLIISFKRGDEESDAFYAELEKKGTMLLHEVRPFDSMDDRRKLVTSYLEKFFKELDEPRIQTLINADGATNPLFLKIALSELRVFGAHNDLTTIMKSFGYDPSTAFDAVLSRLERDSAYFSIAPRQLVPHVFGWLAHSKHGLSVDEISALLVREGLSDNLADARDAVHPLFRQLRHYLAKRDGRIDFFYESFMLAARKRYSFDYGRPSLSSLNAAPSWVVEKYKSDPSILYHKRFQDHDLILEYLRDHPLWHESLAEYFEALPMNNRHKLMEQAWQYAQTYQYFQRHSQSQVTGARMEQPGQHAQVPMSERLLSLLWDYRFIKAKFDALGLNALLEDYRTVEQLESHYTPKQIYAISLLREALLLSAQAVTNCPDQFAHQLYNHLSNFEQPEIIQLRQQIIDLNTHTPNPD
jgi:hypothetical protein